MERYNITLKNKPLFFQNFDSYTGSVKILRDIIEDKYPNEIVDVIAMVSDGGGFLSDLDNVRIHKVCYPRINNKGIPIISGVICKLHAILLAFTVGLRYDIFYVNTIVPWWGALVGRFMRKDVIYHIHEKSVGNESHKEFREIVFNNTKAHRIFVSNYTKSCYPEKGNCPSEVIYNKLPLSFLDKVEIVPIKGRKKNTLLMIASLSKKKGVEMFVEAASMRPKYNFILIVSANKAEIDSYFKQPLPANLSVVPTQKDIHPYLAKVDVVMNLSNPFFGVETFGLTILEGMSYGLPSIVPNVGGPTELVENGYNGYCIDVTSTEEVTKAIDIVLEEENYIRLAENAVHRFEIFK